MDDNCSSGLILPDSRLQGRDKAVVRGTVEGFGSINLTPIFCGNCGVPYGLVPEDNMDFIFWLCDPCAEQWGAQYGIALMPEEAFWAKVQDEQLEKYGRLLSPEELQAVAESTWSPLSKLLRER